MAEAKVSKETAEQTALTKVPNGTIKEAEIEKEHGKLIWSFDVATPDAKDITEVNVDAITGNVVSVEKEAAESEAKEAAGEKDKDNDKDKTKFPAHQTGRGRRCETSCLCRLTPPAQGAKVVMNNSTKTQSSHEKNSIASSVQPGRRGLPRRRALSFHQGNSRRR